uniref:Uncharacterized protein n=1 Tax=Rhizobium rhizogenes TaxID=359 RepID=A0A7S4ZTF5_RHIRH|nr:hypothetical protein pC5.7d_667 [Rhizobium rhizogenes]
MSITVQHRDDPATEIHVGEIFNSNFWRMNTVPGKNNLCTLETKPFAGSGMYANKG